MGREYGRIGETNAYSFSHAFGMTAPSGRELRLSTKIGETNSFSHAFGMTAPSRREPDCQQSLSKKQILHKTRARNARPYGYAVAFFAML